MLAFGPFFLIVCLYIGLHMCLCGNVSMCILCMLDHCMSDMTTIMQSAVPIG